MSESESSPQPGDLRVWYIPQVPMTPFVAKVIPHHEGNEEKEMALAAILLDTIINFSIFEFENRIKPDYSDAGGVERWEEVDDKFGWYEVDPEEYEVEED